MTDTLDDRIRRQIEEAEAARAAYPDWMKNNIKAAHVPASIPSVRLCEVDKTRVAVERCGRRDIKICAQHAREDANCASIHRNLAGAIV